MTELYPKEAVCFKNGDTLAESLEERGRRRDISCFSVNTGLDAENSVSH